MIVRPAAIQRPKSPIARTITLDAAIPAADRPNKLLRRQAPPPSDGSAIGHEARAVQRREQCEPGLATTPCVYRCARHLLQRGSAVHRGKYRRHARPRRQEQPRLEESAREQGERKSTHWGKYVEKVARARHSAAPRARQRQQERKTQHGPRVVAQLAAHSSEQQATPVKNANEALCVIPTVASVNMTNKTLVVSVAPTHTQRPIPTPSDDRGIRDFFVLGGLADMPRLLPASGRCLATF